MFSRFFIHRPVFAWVISIAIMLAGVFAIASLPIAQYPDVAPPSVSINATYAGASAETLENSVTQVIEQQLTGLDGLLYFSSSSSSSGNVNITATFEKGTNPDTAQVQVQNKVQQALTRLPTEVQQQGVTVTKSQSNFLLIMSLYDSSDKASSADIADYMVSNLQDSLARVAGVGDVKVFGSQYAMRIWLNPTQLAAYSLMPSDISTAIEAQNVQVAAGKIGALPARSDQQLTATVMAQSQLKTVEQFNKIVVKSDTNGALVRLSDVARVELGDEDYSIMTRLNGHPAAGIAVMLAPGANALATAERVKAQVAEYEHTMPQGYQIGYPKDSTDFIKMSIEEVVKTLFEAIVLVVAVMFLFLQNWRATLIPAIAVPVVLLGTFGILSAFGYSINTLTLFGMVLAIGLLVDDAIVVVENVERLMREQRQSPLDATENSMREISSALIGVALVLSAVFLPMAFFGGSTGVIYRQFSITIVSAMALSVLVALTLTPALCATLLRPVTHDANGVGFFARFNRAYQRLQDGHRGQVAQILRRPLRFVLLYGAIVVGMGLLLIRLPTGFLPTEDQGDVMVQFTLPPGATAARTENVGKEIERYFLTQEKDNTKAIFVITGFGFSGSGQNAGMAFVALKNWSERSGATNRADAIAQRAMASLSSLRDAQVFSLTPPAVDGLGQSSGFTFELQASGTTDRTALLAMRDQLLAEARKSPLLSAVRPNELAQMPQLQVDIDNEKANALGLSMSDITATLSSAWGGTYINDFLDRGRVKKVYMQGDVDTRSKPEDLDKWHVRGSGDAMTPFSAFASTRWTFGPESLSRYNGLASYEIQGSGVSGVSSGKAMDEMARLAKALPQGTTYAWSGLSYQERLASGQTSALYAISILVVFLCLAALYESWSIPFSVMLVIPLGIIGAVLAATLRGLENDVYFQVALLTTIGLSAKNAILIVEFAELAYRRGATLFEAALEGASVRLRPVLMTSLAFIMGVLPLAIATGAGANSRISIGSGIVGGTLTATFLTIFLIPMFFMLVRRIFPQIKQDASHRTPKNEENNHDV
ncbi:efflux RND transporter permease subunit [Pectobacterium zantedeschiae]|uniref:Efflux pump membrane transporter n=1 Tax=Pectobacterium zantedeschiae TaxID=2034769 RepID=A0A9X8P5Y0_9GAMM|nr:efflux RND transporter permease subunit [Pectobacterium zantedeschiae]RYC38276.1 hydrophobe/amphiphile efflux-1 family RND transporter [Pectobacterium zantedeschiae]RYC44921.1 efflux RND transporter permease subunit [Pectobacterium zantedeschiae]